MLLEREKAWEYDRLKILYDAGEKCLESRNRYISVACTGSVSVIARDAR